MTDAEFYTLLAIMTCAMLLVLAGDTRAAPANGLDTYTTYIAGSGGLGSAPIQQTWYVAYPDARPDHNATTVAITITGSAAAAAYTLSLGTTTTQGCTFGSLATTTGTTFGITARLPVNLTAPDCTATVEFVLTAGTAVSRIQARISLLTANATHDVRADVNWTNSAEAVAPLAWLLWLVAAVVTRLIPVPVLRVGADLVMATILALPVGEGQFVTLLTMNLALLVWDLFRLL